MRVTALSLRDFRSFEHAELEFGQINLFLGRNNTGKSTLLQALYSIQSGTQVGPADVRKGAESAQIIVGLDEMPVPSGFGNKVERSSASVEYVIGPSGGMTMRYDDSSEEAVSPLPPDEPAAFFIPLFNRRPQNYQEQIQQAATTSIRPNWENLPARLDRLTNQQNPASRRLLAAMKEIVGVEVTAVHSANGKLAGSYVSPTDSILLERMGAGVANAVTLLASLIDSKDKAFLIEEPENDLHPTALRKLLEVIERESSTNQFFISTHSQVVLRHLGSTPNSRIFSVTSERDATTPTSRVAAIEDTTPMRRQVLDDLGYELYDYDLYDGWLILEEASAERIIRDYLVKWFAPRLVGRLRTISAQGVDDVEPMFHDFRRLFLYLHLEEHYHERAWVLVDGGRGDEVVKKLQDQFSTWPNHHFVALKEHDFEHYYPEEFQQKAAAALAKDGRSKRDAKRELLEEVRLWSDEDDGRAKDAFETSATEVIEFLRKVEATLVPLGEARA